MRKSKSKLAADKRVTAPLPEPLLETMIEVFDDPGWLETGGPSCRVQVLGVIKNCEPTDFGWRGVLNGARIEVRPECPGSHINIPFKDRVLLHGPDGIVIGAFLLERAITGELC